MGWKGDIIISDKSDTSIDRTKNNNSESANTRENKRVMKMTTRSTRATKARETGVISKEGKSVITAPIQIKNKFGLFERRCPAGT